MLLAWGLVSLGPIRLFSKLAMRIDMAWDGVPRCLGHTKERNLNPKVRGFREVNTGCLFNRGFGRSAPGSPWGTGFQSSSGLAFMKPETLKT